jgi:anti-sigma B factor antagonist
MAAYDITSDEGARSDVPRLGVERWGETILVWVSGELDLFTQYQLNDALQAQLASDAATLVLDLQHVSFVSCSALRVLINCAIRARERDITLLVRPSPAVSRIATAVGVTDQLGLDPCDHRAEG